MMTKARAYTFLIAILSSFICFGFIELAFERQAMFELFNAVCVSISVGVIVGFSKAAWFALREPFRSVEASDVLVLGVWVLWVGLLILFANMWAYRLTQDIYWLNNPLAAFSRWLVFIGGTLHLAASGAIDNRIPQKSYVRTGVVIAFGVAVALFLIGIGVD